MADYVIVGGGSAGCVLAEALSARHSVVVIEAGGSDRVTEVAIPAAFSKLFKTSRDWDFCSESEPGAADRSLYLPRGKMVGGSSSMNAMLYIRGRPSDYDGWESGGAEGWGWKSVLDVFKAMESNGRGADQFHGDAGPVRVEDIRSPRPVSRRFIEAAVAAGIPANDDFNGPRQEGTGLFQVTQRRGRRWSAADAYLRPALRRRTLEVRTGARASRVLIEDGRATGVEYVKDGEASVIRAEAEVILAAGAFGSPHVLQLSGIGDADQLISVGIEALVDSPEVGRNLQDHPVAAVLYDSKLADTLDDAENPVELARWLLFRSGRLTSPVAEACAFVSSPAAEHGPDLQFHFGPVSFDNHGLDPYDGHAFTLGPVLLTPASRGTVAPRSPDPMSAPAIQVNCLSVQGDVDALVHGVELAREIVSQDPLDDYRGEELKPGPDVQSPSELEDYVRANVELLYHPVGTCRMGSEARSVVDPQLRVRGVEGLRVVDASVMPRIISGNTNAPTMMIAARAAQMILAAG